MKKQPLSTIINFCSNDRRFIRATIEEALLFSQQVIIPVCDHFFDGSGENRPLLESLYAAFPSCLFIEYPFIPQAIPKKILKSVDPAHFWHSCSRLIGYSFLDEDIEAVLFLDADEVPEGHRFAAWLESSDYRQHTALKLSNYWYFRESCYQALNMEDSVVLVQRKALDPEVLLHQEERDAIYNLLPQPKRRFVNGTDGHPMFHHYSWVRTKEEMLKKVSAWGHKGDRDWVRLVHEEFLGPFKGSDFVHGYSYRQVPPLFDILMAEPSFEPRGVPQVKRLTPHEMLGLIRKKKIWNFLDF